MKATRFGIPASGWVLLVSLALPVAASAAYPERPIRLVISSAAGGSPDIVTRILCTELTKQRGQQIVIDNRPGGAQTIGTEMVVRAIPDGYTLGYANVVTLAINKTLLPKQPYDPDRDRNQDPAAVFASRRAYCVGYAELAVDLLRRVGISARTVQGILRTDAGADRYDPEIGGVYHELGANFSGAAWGTGTLNLYFWDENNGDNYGNIKFDIKPRTSVDHPGNPGPGVPEPATWALMIAGFSGAGAMLRRKRAGAFA